MNETTAFLREQTISGANKIGRTIMPSDWTMEKEAYSIPERKALGLKKIFDNMPIFIGEKEKIVGTRTFFASKEGGGNHPLYDYSLGCGVPYLNEKEIKDFGGNQSFVNKTHYTPDFSIILNGGIKGIFLAVEKKEQEKTLRREQREFLSSVKIAYAGLQSLITRYGAEAQALAEKSPQQEKENLLGIAQRCKKISWEKSDTFIEAVQLLWFAHLGTIIESFEFINYGRLDVILTPFLKETPKEEAQQIIECLLLKMYDQVDINSSYLQKYAAQLVVTLGGVLPNGDNAVSDVTMLFLEAIDSVRLPEPEFNLRIHSKNPSAFLDRAAMLSISGCNFISYYNDDLFIESLTLAGIPEETARCYGFDLCQDINIPGQGDFYHCGDISLTHLLMETLKETHSFENFEALFSTYKTKIAQQIRKSAGEFNCGQKHIFQYADGCYEAYFNAIWKEQQPIDWSGRSPMSPLPYLSALYHGTISNATDMIYESYPVKEKGIMFGTATEAVNSLAAIRKIVYDLKQHTLAEVVQACVDNFEKDGQEIMRHELWNAPKWGNDDDYADNIAKELLEFSLEECQKYKTYSGGQVLGGIHQPHPIPTGAGLMATPEGRRAKTPVSVTLTPESGTMKNGATAALKSATKIDHKLVQWNFCIMINYFSSVFQGNDGKQIFKDLILGYFENGGMQHQPNVLDVEALKEAQKCPHQYKDLIVRLWGVSAHFVDLSKELQDEMIARFS